VKKISLSFVLALITGLILVPTFAFASEERAPEIKVFDTLSGQTAVDFMAYSSRYGGGAAVAVGDILGSSHSEIVTVSGIGGRTHVRGFTHKGRFNGLSLFPFHPDYRGGGDIAVGDIDGDDKDEIIVSARSQSESRIKVYDGKGQVISDFLAFSPEFKGGAYVSAGDLNGDGRDEIVVGAGAGGNPHVRVFDGYGHYIGLDYFPYPFEFKGGVDVGVADYDNDKRDEIAMSPATSGEARIKIYDGDNSHRILSDFVAFNNGYKDGARVAGADIDGDGSAEIITGPSSNSVPEVKTFETDGMPARFNKLVYENDFRGGIDVAGGFLESDTRASIVTAPQRFIWEGRRDLWKYIDIDLSNQMLYVYEGGRQRFAAITSSGRPGMVTPTGQYYVMSKEPMHWSAKYGLYMPNSLKSSGAYKKRQKVNPPDLS